MALAQDKEKDLEPYEKSLSLGLITCTNGGVLGGGSLRFSSLATENKYHSFGIEMVNIKHPKEMRVISNQTGSAYIYGKQSYLLALRTQYGKDIVLFKKAPDHGVQINLLLAGGPSFGILAPYLVTYGEDEEQVVFDPAIHDPDMVWRTVPFPQCLAKSSLRMGLNLKASFIFEMNPISKSISGFEAGFIADFFPKKITLVPYTANRSVYTALFVNFFFGYSK